MFNWLLTHQWKSQQRSSVWHRNLLVNLFLVLTLLYLVANFLFLGFVLDDILLKLFPRTSPLEKLNKYLLYFFFADFILRYFFQKLPALDILPYLHLPIKKGSLASLILLKSAFGMYNWLSWFLLIPFSLDLVLRYYPLAAFAGWTTGVVFTVVFVNYLLIYIKKATGAHMAPYLVLIAVFALLVGLEWWGIFDFSIVSSALFGQLHLRPWTAIVPVALAAFMFGINYRYLKSHMYAEDLLPEGKSSTGALQTGFLTRLGQEGLLMDTELKLIWRNKRPRSVLLMTTMFLFYGLLIFTNPDNEGSYPLYIIFAIIITGMFTLNYGQYLLGWESAHFDQVLTRNSSFRTYYRSKFYLLSIVSTLCMVLALPYAYFGWDILYVLFCVWLFNVGINTATIMFFGSLNPKKIELGKSTVFNWQGVGAAQFLLAIPAIILPFLIYTVTAFFTTPMTGITALGLTGVAGLLMIPLFIRWLAMFLQKRRHDIASGFREP